MICVVVDYLLFLAAATATVLFVGLLVGILLLVRWLQLELRQRALRTKEKELWAPLSEKKQQRGFTDEERGSLDDKSEKYSPF